MKTNSVNPKFCGECGVPFEQGASFCGACGTTVDPQEQKKPDDFKTQTKHGRAQEVERNSTSLLDEDSKKKSTATLLAMFLGGFGAHKFYMGSWGWGIVYFLTCWFTIPFLVAIAETVRYVLMTDEEFRVKAESFKDKGPFGFF